MQNRKTTHKKTSLSACIDRKRKCERGREREREREQGRVKRVFRGGIFSQRDRKTERYRRPEKETEGEREVEGEGFVVIIRRLGDVD